MAYDVQVTIGLSAFILVSAWEVEYSLNLTHWKILIFILMMLIKPKLIIRV